MTTERINTADDPNPWMQIPPTIQLPVTRSSEARNKYLTLDGSTAFNKSFNSKKEKI